MAKGINGPFGIVNWWLFHLPGFNLFRDPTKYYVLVAISYSIMIPISISVFLNLTRMKPRTGYWLRTGLILAISILLLIPIRQAWMGKLRGTFVYHSIPKEYMQLADFLSSQSHYSRTLWLPTLSRFRFDSEEHPNFTADNLFTTTSPLLISKELAQNKEKSLLQNLSIRYIIVPDDTEKEIFLIDRNYDDKKRNKLIQDLDKIAYLQKQTIGKLILYQVPNPKDHFYFMDGSSVVFHKNNSSDYTLFVDIPQQKVLIFSEGYHPGWIIKIVNKTINSVRTKEGLNSFKLPSGRYILHVEFFPDQFQILFYSISIVFLVSILIIVFLISD